MQIIKCVIEDGNAFEEVKDLVDMGGGYRIFWWRPFQNCWKAFEEISKNDLYIDSVSFINQLEKTGLLNAVITSNDEPENEDDKTLSGRDAIKRIMRVDANRDNIETYVSQLIEVNALRQIQVHTKAADESVLKGKPSAEVLANLDFELSKIVSISGAKNFNLTNVKDVAKQAMEDILIAYGGKSPYIETGISCIDEIFGGSAPGCLYMVAANSGEGKSVLLSDLAYNWSVINDQKTGFITLEMSNKEVVNRFIQIITGIDSIRIRKGSLKESELEQCRKALEIIQSGNIIFDDSPELNVAQVRQKCRKMKAEGCTNVLIDQLQQVLPPQNLMGKQESVIYDFTAYRFKAFSREFDLGIWFAHQTNKDDKNYKDNVSLSKINYGGVRACDGVLIITHEGEQSFFNFVKNRHGKKDKCEVLFDRQHVFFKDIKPSLPPELEESEFEKNRKKKNDDLFNHLNDEKMLNKPVEETPFE
jgi:replicative DNA helicase